MTEFLQSTPAQAVIWGAVLLGLCAVAALYQPVAAGLQVVLWFPYHQLFRYHSAGMPLPRRKP